MRHLFYVHSHITNLVAKQVILEEKLPEEDCLFLLARNYKSDFTNTIKLPYTHYPIDSFKVQLLFWRTWRKLNQLDHWVKKITNGDSFLFYIPQSGFNLIHLVVNNEKCKGYAYIEEGLCSYLPEEKLRTSKKEFWLRDKLYDLNFKKRSKSVKHFYDLNHPKYKGCYGISTHSFPGLPKSTQLGLPFVEKENNNAFEHVIVLGQYVEYGEMKKETLLEVIQYLLEWLVAQKVGTVHVKFHPAQTKAQSILSLEELFEEYSSKVKIISLEQGVVLENIAFTTDAAFYMISSSTGIYASIAGNKVYCLARKVTELEPLFQKKIDDFPDFLISDLIYI